MGRTGTRKYGVTPVMTTKVPRIMVRQLRKFFSCCGILASIMSRSEENLFRILPVGVVSKNIMGACMVVSSKEWWIFLGIKNIKI